MTTDMNRRAFLGGALGLVAASALPSLAKDDPALLPTRGKFERLSVSYARVHLGLAKPFSVLHVSDTHLTAAYPHESEIKLKLQAARSRTFGGLQETALADTLAWAKAHVDYVVHTGDLIDWQSEANFDLVKKHFGAAAVSLIGAPGNHEYSRSMWLEKETKDEANRALTRDRLAKVYPYDLTFGATIVNGVNFVTMDDVYGTVTEAQVARFKAEVAKGLPIVLCMHVPFYTDDIWRATYRFWHRCGKRFESGAVPPFSGDCARQRQDAVTSDFIAYLKGEKLLKALFVGHEHIDVADRFSLTAMEYVTGGNFLFHAREVLFT